MTFKELAIRALASAGWKRAVEIEQNCMRVRLDFAHAIKQEMARRGMDQKHLALRLGWYPSQVSAVLNGRLNLSARTIERVADAVGLSVSYKLVPKKEEEQKP